MTRNRKPANNKLEAHPHIWLAVPLRKHSDVTEFFRFVLLQGKGALQEPPRFSVLAML